MNLLKTIKNRVSSFFKAASELTPMPTYQKSTARQRKAADSARARYIHESTKLEPVPKWAQPLMGSHVRIGKGIRYTSLRGHVRRAADEVAQENGLNNKQRRRLRSSSLRKMEQQMGELS